MHGMCWKMLKIQKSNKHNGKIAKEIILMTFQSDTFLCMTR